MITDKDKKTIEEALKGLLRGTRVDYSDAQSSFTQRQADINLGHVALALLSKPEEEQKPEVRYDMQRRMNTGCQADADDDMCTWAGCPQLRDGEPKKSGRHCPLDKEPEEAVAPAPDMPIVTHLNIDLNASLETKQAVADVVKAAYNYAPPAPDEKQKPEEQPSPFRELSDAHCERIAKRFGDEGEGSVHTGTTIGRARFLRWVRDHYYVPLRPAPDEEDKAEGSGITAAERQPLLDYIRATGGLLARKRLCVGSATVKSTSTLRYKGLTLPVLAIYIEHKGDKWYAPGSKTYLLSLLGTEWGSEQHETDIHEKELENISVREIDSMALFDAPSPAKAGKVLTGWSNIDIHRMAGETYPGLGADVVHRRIGYMDAMMYLRDNGYLAPAAPSPDTAAVEELVKAGNAMKDVLEEAMNYCGLPAKVEIMLDAWDSAKAKLTNKEGNSTGPNVTPAPTP